MLNFFSHPKFEKEAERAKQRSTYFDEALISFEKLCQVQFNTENPRMVIAPGKLHKLFDGAVYSIWKIELAVKGTKSNQSPRIWFAIHGNEIVYLCIAMHSDNYNDGAVTDEAVIRCADFFSI